MIRPRIALIVVIASLALPSLFYGRDIPPFVSSDWLHQNLDRRELLIIDVRSDEDYLQGHIPDAVNVPGNSWAVDRNGLLRELPADSELSGLMGSAGIGEDSMIIVVGRWGSDFDRADAIRVAWTILVAGVRNVAVLDGGFSKWVREKKPVSVEPPSLQPVEYAGTINRSGLASKDYVLGKIGTAVLVDNRTPEVYFGITTEFWAPKPGHISGARNLPAPWIFRENGLIRSRSELESMAHGVIGKDKTKEIITYCGAGPFASVWSYILTEMLGYEKVKVYDGSMQEWIMDPAGPVEMHTWR